jgi:hypothetical protein
LNRMGLTADEVVDIARGLISAPHPEPSPEGGEGIA